MKTRIAALSFALLAGLSTQAAAQAVQQDGPWLVRLRATYLDTDTSSSAVPGVIPADGITVNSKWIPELDVTYFFTKNIAAELVLTVPQKHDVSIAGLGTIGTFKHLPPTLLAQWHFDQFGAFKPYVGAGINYTRLSSERMSALGAPVTLESSSWGGALQIGADYAIDRKWSVNVDVKKLQIRSDVFLAGEQISRVKVDPWLLSVGVGYRF